MTAEVRPLQTGGGERSVYLDAYLAPFQRWLDVDTITEIIVNRPGEVWIEDAAHPGMQRIEAPEIDDRLVQRLAEQVARVSHQGINREHPLLGARLRTCVATMDSLPPQPVEHVLGAVDAAKFRSCLTLFSAAGADFQPSLERWYGGAPDSRTLELLRD